ncbi:MFS transporter [Angustibacter aerolatus]
MPAPTDLPPRLTSRALLPLSIGVVGLVTLSAFVDRAVATVLPTALGDLGSVSSFGAVAAAPLASYVAALAVSGLWADRLGPRPVVVTGLAAFVVAQVVTATAQGVPVLVGSRLLSGVAEALVDVGLTVLIADVLPDELLPRMYSLLSAAWVLPSVVGPVVAGALTEHAGWRWVFVVPVVAAVPPAVLLLTSGGLRAPHRAPAPTSGRSALTWSLVLAAALTAAGLSRGRWLVLLPAVALALVGLWRVLPPGTLRLRPGVPLVVAVRGLGGTAFSASTLWLPLVLTLVHGATPTGAGVPLTVVGVFWFAGSWVQGHVGGSRPRMLRAGLACLVVGLAGTGLLGFGSLPVWPGLVALAVAGVGVGITTATSSVLIISASAMDERGRAGASAQLVSAAGIGLATAVAGAALARTGFHGGALFVWLSAATTLLALTGLLAATRLRSVEVPVAPGGGSLPR